MADLGLRGRVALVTGANNPEGIGAAIARALAREGVKVVVHGHRSGPVPPKLPSEPGLARVLALQTNPPEVVAESIRADRGWATACELDLVPPGAAVRLLELAESLAGPVDILVNNAAVAEPDSFVENDVRVLDPESHDLHFAVNCRTPALLTAELGRRLRERRAGWGRVVMVSTDGASGHAGAVSYGASKHALESYARAAAWELGPDGITVNVVAPGPVQTGWISGELESVILPRIPLGRIGKPDEVADAVVFLASDMARWITGEILYVGGGHVMPL